MTEDVPQTAMLLTQEEWEMLADICAQYKMRGQDPTPYHTALCDRIIEAVWA